MSTLDRPEGDARPPWEQPGCVRRDCVSHHGPILFAAGAAGMLSGLFALCLPLLALAGIPLGLGTLLISRNDLEQMRRGLMDPEGEDLTTDAFILGAGGLTLSMVTLLLLCCRLGMDLYGW